MKYLSVHVRGLTGSQQARMRTLGKYLLATWCTLQRMLSVRVLPSVAHGGCPTAMIELQQTLIRPRFAIAFYSLIAPVPLKNVKSNGTCI